MLNRVIYGGEVYYKVADLAELFESSVYKMRKAVKELEIGERLEGFGRMVFVSEKNVALIDVDCKTVKLKTKIKEAGNKFLEVQDGHTENGKPKSKKIKLPLNKMVQEGLDELEEARQSKIESDAVAQECTENVEAPTTEPEKLQVEHASLKELGNDWTRKYTIAGKMNVAREIFEKHCGIGFVLADSTLEDIDGLRATIKELETEYEKLNQSLTLAPEVITEVTETTITF